MSGAPLDLSYTANHPQALDLKAPGLNSAERPSRCPARQGWVYFDYVTGLASPARCGRNACGFCIVGNARRRAAAIAYAQPEREITLTQVGRDWKTVLHTVNKLFELVRREGIHTQQDFHVEVDPNGQGQHHCHAWQKGDPIPKRVLTDLAVRAGAGKITHISRIRDTQQASNYGLKGLQAARYGLKGTISDPAVYLAANGGRLSHHSRRFYLSESGESIGVRQAERLGMAALHGAENGEHSWTLVRETSLASVERVRQMATARASATRGVRPGPSSTAGSRPSTR